MRRFDRGGTLNNAHVRVAVLSFVSVTSLLFSSNTHALTVEPIIDTIVSVAKVNEPENRAAADDRRGSSRSNVSPAQSSTSKDPDAVTQSPLPAMTSPDDTIVTEPIEQLPTIDTAEMPSQTVHIYRPASSLTVSHAVIGATTTDAVTPLQASDHGWRFFGVAWYWWLLGGLIVYIVIRHISLLQYRQAIRQEFVAS